MDRSYLLKSPFKAAFVARILAKSIDLFIVLILAVFFYPVGVLFATLYIAIADSFSNGQSVGKRFVGFRVIDIEDGEPCTTKQSALRNAPILIPLIFLIIPFWGWIFTALIGGPLVSLEVYLLFKLDSGNRLGDVMADTTVVSIIGDSLKEKKLLFEKERTQAL